MKRIMHLTFDMRIGGTEQVIKNLIEGSDKTRFEMSVFCLEQPLGPFGEMLVEQGIEVSGLNRQPGFDISVIKKLRKHLKNNKIDVLHCHQYTPWVYGTLASQGLDIPIIFTEHGRFYPDRTSWKRFLINPLLARLTSRITAISKATKEALIDFEFIPRYRISVIYNGISPLALSPEVSANLKSELGIDQGYPVIGTIARFDPIKNHRMMFQAFKKVLQTYPNVYLLIVGDGDEKANLVKLVDDLKIANRVIFSGYIDNPSRHLEIMDIYLLSSLSEGTSMTLLEAMSLSKPCIVTDAGGNPEIIENNLNGIVTANGDAQQFAAAIRTLLDDENLRKKLGNASHDIFLRKFSATAMCRAFEKLYESV